MISIDTECNGLDLFHGVLPFIVTTCNMRGEQVFFEWEVDPYTRKPIIPERDIDDVKELIENADELVLQNSKFDVHVLTNLIPDLKWDWSKTHDTLVAAHVLASNEIKNLSALSIRYLNESIQKYEDATEKAVKEGIKFARKYCPSWRLAKRDLAEIPSAKNKVWKYDLWLPRAMAKKKELPESDSLFHVTNIYANKDTEITLKLWKGYKDFPGIEYLLRSKGLWKHYLFRMESIRIAQEMERRGVTHSAERTETIAPVYKSRARKIERECVSIAEKLGYDLSMPKKGINNSVRKFLDEYLKLPPVYNKKGKRTYDKKEAIPLYLDTLSPGSLQLQFIQNMVEKGKYDNSLAYIRDYKRYSLPTDDPSTLLLHPNVNPVGSSTLRWTHNNPNSANISNQPDAQGKSLRYLFGPGPGREWWSLDAKNVERRIPDFESKEPDMIALYEKENEPPFYGSFHILVFSVIWEELWNKAVKEVGIKEAGAFCKKKYKSEYYAWTKNFNFAIQYGSGRENADRTAHRIGAYDLIAQRFTKLSALNQMYINNANRTGYVETLPDRTVDPTRGYPLLCTLMDNGRVLTTIPLSYHVQGTAMWITSSAMNKVDTQLQEWRKDNWDAFITMQIHDEIIIDAPKRANPKENPRQSNLGRMRVIQSHMETCGNDLVPSIPVPFGLEYHENNWSKGIAF